MIAKFPSVCVKCGGSIPKGEDVSYDYQAKKVSHWNCEGKTESRSEASEQLAERLGFRYFSWEFLRKLSSPAPDDASGNSDPA